MPRIEVRDASPHDLVACAELLAARHLRDRATFVHAEPELGTANGAKAALQGIFESPRADVLVAEAANTVIGFLSGERMLLPPNDFASQFIPPHSISMALEGHAVAAGQDATEVYRALYAELGGRWASDGFFVQRIAIPAGDAGVQEAWVSLGFGRYLVAATRTVAPPVPNPKPRTLSVERASPEDIDDVLALSDDLMAWHWRSPMFWPNLHVTADAVREFTLASLRSAETPFFMAYENGKPVAMQTFLRPGFTPPTVKRSSDVYLFEGVVANDARGGGIGATLLKHSIDWARGAGWESCTLHFASGNPTGGPFWLGHGFQPVEYTMERTIDSRVAWAKPRI